MTSHALYSFHDTHYIWHLIYSVWCHNNMQIKTIRGKYLMSTIYFELQNLSCGFLGVHSIILSAFLYAWKFHNKILGKILHRSSVYKRQKHRVSLEKEGNLSTPPAAAPHPCFLGLSLRSLLELQELEEHTSKLLRETVFLVTLGI